MTDCDDATDVEVNAPVGEEMNLMHHEFENYSELPDLLKYLTCEHELTAPTRHDED